MLVNMIKLFQKLYESNLFRQKKVNIFRDVKQSKDKKNCVDFFTVNAQGT